MSGIRVSVVFLIAWSASAWAGPKVAVLEAIGPPKTPAARLMSWTDAVRGVMLEGVPSTFVVLTRSNIESFLPPGVDLADCEGECEITTARKIGAEYVVGIRVMAEGAARTITVGLHAAIDGRLLGQGRVSVPSADIEAGLRDAATQAIAIWQPTTPEAATAPGGAPSAGGVRVVHAKPLEWLGAPIVQIDSTHGVMISTRGRRVGPTPVNILLEGKKSVQVRAEAPGYQAQTFDIQTGGGSGQVVLDLARNGASVVFDVPMDDIEVHVDGRLALRGRSHTVEAGRRQFQIMHPCLRADAISVDIEAGSTQTITVPHVVLCGRVMLRSPTPGAQVRWNGEWRDLPFISLPRAPTESEPTPRQVEIGVRAKGHRGVSRTITIPATGTEVTEIALAPDWVEVSVEAKRWTGEACPGVLVIDGERTQTSRWRGRLMAGAHTFKARCGGGRHQIRKTIHLSSPRQEIVLQQRGPQGESSLTADRASSFAITARGWTAPRVPGGPRFSLGLAAGLLTIDDVAPIFGLELGLGFPVTGWMEIAGFASGFVAARDCPDGAPSDEDCNYGYGNLRAVLRVDVGGAVLDAGWGWSVDGAPADGARTGQGLQFGLGWTY